MAGGSTPFRYGLACRCPRCGGGKLFSGFLTVAERCAVCDLDLGKADSGDGPAVFLIFILGFIVVPMALVVEVTYAPPYWLHWVLWPPMILGGALGLLRPMKGLLIAIQYHYRASDSGSANYD